MIKRLGTILLVLMLSIFGVAALASAATIDEVDSITISSSGADPTQTSSIDDAILWVVQNHQNDDGGYASFSTGANVATSTIRGTVDAILSIAATGYHPAIALVTETVSPIDFLLANSAEMQTTASASGGDAGKIVQAIVASHANPADFGGTDYVAILAGTFSVTTGAADSTAFRHSLAMLGMAAAGEPVPTAAITHLIGKQAVDGSWDDGFGTTQNADSTAMAIMALLAAGEAPTSTAITNAKTFLASAQLTSGGFEYGTGFGESPNSTALVMQALSALGENFYSSGGAWDAGTDATPLAALFSYQNTATGAFQANFGGGPLDDYFTTIGSIVGMSGKPYPLQGRYAATQAAIDCLANLQDATTGGWSSFEGGLVDAGGTSRAIQALVRGGADLTDSQWETVSGTLPLSALEALTSAYIDGSRGGRTGIVMQGASRLGADVSDFAAQDLSLSMIGHLTPTGALDSTGFGPFSHAEALLGIIDSQYHVLQPAVVWLNGAQVNPGDWGSPDSTGIALQVFGKLGQDFVPQGGATLLASQLSDGGWGFSATSNPNSTSEVVQGLWASGYQPYGPQWSTVVSGTVVNSAETIQSQQLANGCWQGFNGGDDPFSTTDALIMLSLENEQFEYSPTAVIGYRTLLPIIIR